MIQRSSAQRIAFSICTIGVLLHTYTAFILADRPIDESLLGFLIWSSTPYLISYILARKPHRAPIAVGAASASLLGDSYMHYLVFIGPKIGSTAGIGLIFMPLWNLLFIAPLGAFVALVYMKRDQK